MFDHWSGDLSGITNPSQVTMVADRTVSASCLPVDQAGKVKLIVTYANGSGATRSLSLSINGLNPVASTFDATTDWTTWQTKEFDISVVAGFNVLSLSTINGQDGPNIDKVTLALGATRVVCDTRPPQFSYLYNSRNRSLQMSWNHLEQLTVKI